MVSNREISRLLSLYAELLLLHQKQEQMAARFSSAVYRIRQMPDNLAMLSKQQLLLSFPAEVVSILEELKTTGTIAALDEIIQLTPPGLFDMMRIRGLGGKKLALLWKTGKIDSLESLLLACKQSRLQTIPGFGAKTEQNIIQAIENEHRHQTHFHYAFVADTAQKLVIDVQKICNTRLVSLCGEIRRQSTTVPGIDLVVAIPPAKLTTTSMRRILHISSSVDGETRAHTLDEIPVRIFHTTTNDFHRALFHHTGADAHVQKVLPRIKGTSVFSSEAALYKKANLSFIPPELREDFIEWDMNDFDNLVTMEDIQGVVHNHTTWSDGVDSLKDFAMACKRRHYQYVVISDHSKNAHYAGGLKEEKVLRQLIAIDDLNKKLSPFKIFKSIECDIRVSGELDYDLSLLRQLDLVIVSIHQLLKMDIEKATRRLIKAIEHPCTTILGHMTGRQLLIRPGYPVHFHKIIDACAANGVVIEINANPYRLDMDWSHIPYALKKGVMIAIDPDAHSIAEIDNIRWGVAAARKGGLTKEMTWNAMSLQQIESWMKKK